jgi:release factor glutamine methyltransferase
VTAPITVSGIRRTAAARLRAAGIESAELDARLLIGHALTLDHVALAAQAARGLSAAEETAIGALIGRRLAREPVARIVGTKEFWSLALRIDESTLVPRPETETLVEAALAAVDARGKRTQALRIVDLGTGCGAILLALLSELPNALGLGLDISPAALGVAGDNADRLGLVNANFMLCDIAASRPAPLPELMRGPIDLIVSNPPYVATGDIAGLEPEVRLFDPHAALDGGPDGLTYYRAIAAGAVEWLGPGGSIAVELGAGLLEPVAALFAAAGLALSPPHSDLNGVPRVLVARKLQAHWHDATASDPGKKALGMLAGTD